MTTSQVRQAYLDFFQGPGRDHVVIPAAPLVPENDPTTLFTSSGMQPLVSYLLGQPHPSGKRLVDVQPCIRTVDIEAVGDNRHLTYFEMLGNWSLGDYFKAAQLPWIWEFFTKVLALPKDRLAIGVFEGTAEVARDEESVKIWKSLGVPGEKIFYYGVDKNWWSRSGTPEEMPEGEIGGPDSEVFYEFTQVQHDSQYGSKCHPNCDCGRFMEIGNSVFIQYRKSEGKLRELSQKNVDFGGGLERMTAAIDNDPDVFKTDVYQAIISRIETKTGKPYRGNETAMRIMADHIRTAEALGKEGVVPANKLQGYVLRRLIRRAVMQMRNLVGAGGTIDFTGISSHETVLQEVDRFKGALDQGLKEMEKIGTIDARAAFHLYQTYGFPWELTQEMLSQRGQTLDRREFEAEAAQHQAKSRTAAAGMFKGGLADVSETTTKLHTATHLLHQALRQVLGPQVQQRGSHITTERLRFDFSYPRVLTEVEWQRVTELVNQKIKQDLPVRKTIEDKQSALKSGALAFFAEKYPDQVSVYTIGDFSRELCGGPHVTATGKIGFVRIDRDKALGAGVRRIYARLENR